MRNYKNTLIMLFSCSVISTPALATKDPLKDFNEKAKISKDKLHEQHKGELLYGDIEFGVILNKGNTDNNSLKFKSNLYQDFTQWRNQIKLDGFHRREKDKETGEEDVSASRYFVSGQANYKIGEDNKSFFIYGDYERDRFNGKEYTATAVIGYGNRIFEGRKNIVDLDIGPGFSVARVDNEITLEEGQDRMEQGQLLRLALQWKRNISKRTRFTQDVSYERSLSGLNSRVFAETSLVTQVVGGVSLKFGYTYRYNSQPESTKQKVDTELGASLVYSFN